MLFATHFMLLLFTELGNKPDSLQSPPYHLKALKSQTHLRQAIAAINIVYNRKLSMCECNFVYVIYILLWFFCHKECFMSLQNESWNKTKCTWNRTILLQYLNTFSFIFNVLQSLLIYLYNTPPLYYSCLISLSSPHTHLNFNYQ